MRPHAHPTSHRTWPLAVAALCALAAAGGCAKGKVPAADAGAAATARQPVELALSNPQLRFTYLGKEGKFALAQRVDEIPAEARGAVMVVDLSQTRADSDLVLVVDLRRTAMDKVTATPMDRPAFERLARGFVEASRPPVIMYATTWCGVCRSARGFLKKHGVAFVEKDVEKEPGAAAELRGKAQAAGVDARGVPVFDVGGKILPGFDEGALRTLLKL